MGLSPAVAPRSRGLRQCITRSFLCKLQLGLLPDFKFELLPLHSPLLGQSLLVSFPPLIDMLKFSGYSYLIRGQHFWGYFTAGYPLHNRSEKNTTALSVIASPPLILGGCGGRRAPTQALGLMG